MDKRAFRLRALSFMRHPRYELLANLSVVANLATLYFPDFFVGPEIAGTNAHYLAWLAFQAAWNLLSAFELGFDMYGNGGIKLTYQREWRACVETACQVVNVVAIAALACEGDRAAHLIDLTKPFTLIVFLRLLKLLPLLRELAAFRRILQTLVYMLEPASSLVVVTLLIMYLFALWGMYMFGGLVQYDSPQEEYIGWIGQFVLMNFNDILSSMVTLFVLMIVNNWYVIANMHVAFKGGQTIYRLYFIFFYFIGNMLATNILVAFAIDIYSVVERLDEQKAKNDEKI